jgi:hypothetical protein
MPENGYAKPVPCDLAAPDELREFGGMPEGVPVFEITPRPRKRRRVLRGDRVELVYSDPQMEE